MDQLTRRWIVVDVHGTIHARIKGAGCASAQKMAAAFLPEFNGQLKLVAWHKATEQQRQMASHVFLITPAKCAEMEMLPAVQLWAEDLQTHFVGGSR